MKLKMYEDSNLVLMEWINPTEDMKVLLHTHPDFRCYCSTAWNENSTLLEMVIKKNAFEKLDHESRNVLLEEIQALNKSVSDSFTTTSNTDRDELTSKGITIFSLDDDLKKDLERNTFNCLKDWYKERRAVNDTLSTKICCSYISHLPSSNTIRALWEKESSLLCNM